MPRIRAPIASHWVCFECRKAFKPFRRSAHVINGAPLPEQASRKCPQCSNPMVNLGRKFKVPKQSDAEQWRKVERLHQAGINFWGGHLPAHLNEVDAFLEKEKGRTAPQFRLSPHKRKLSG